MEEDGLNVAWCSERQAPNNRETGNRNGAVSPRGCRTALSVGVDLGHLPHRVTEETPLQRRHPLDIPTLERVTPLFEGTRGQLPIPPAPSSSFALEDTELATALERSWANEWARGVQEVA